MATHRNANGHHSKAPQVNPRTAPYGGVPSRDIRAVLSAEWSNLTVLVAKLSDQIPPEAAMRYWLRQNKPKNRDKTPLELQLAKGRRALVVKMLSHMKSQGQVERKRLDGAGLVKLTCKGVALREKDNQPKDEGRMTKE